MAVRADDVDLVRDRTLVELCQAGDQRAFGELYDRYYARLLRFSMRRVGNAHEAEEITQEAFVRAFSALPRFAGERRFYPWLTVIASRLCIDSHRRTARSEPAAEVDLGGVEGGQQQVLDNVDLAYLTQAMEQLGPRHREVLDLRETKGWSYQQIADHYDVTMGTVEALLFRARKALRREFMAIAGDDHRRAALPILGLAYRGFSALRSRLHDLSSHALPVACAGAASIVAVAGGYALNHNPTSPAAPVAAPKIVLTEAVTAPVIAVQQGAKAAPAVDASVAIGAPAAPAKPPPRDGFVAGNASDGRTQAENNPSSFSFGGVVVSTNLVKAPAPYLLAQ